MPAKELREESDAWKQAYRNQGLVERRRAKHSGKLTRLGVPGWDRSGALLDLCCGTGEVLGLLQSQGFQNLHGLDVSIDPQLGENPSFHVQAGDGRDLPYATGQFSSVLCMHALHHLGGVQGVAASLNEAARVLRPGGKLGLIDHYDSLQLRLAFWACRQPWWTWITPGLKSFRQQLLEEHDYLYDYLDHFDQMQALISGLGFQTEMNARDPFFFYWVGTKPS